MNLISKRTVGFFSDLLNTMFSKGGGGEGGGGKRRKKIGK